MKIEHIAIWTNQLETLKNFYVEYFHASANEKYINSSKGFESYFISFKEGCRLEIMTMPSIKPSISLPIVGLTHFAVSVGTEDDVLSFTEKMRTNGYTILSEPRRTGDGYFESVIADPDGNHVEITSSM